jgi:hypothetical protein
MNEDPKSIWKKSFKGPRSLLLWLIPLTLIFFVVYANGTVPDSLKNYLGLPAYALFFSLFVTLMLWFAIKFVRWGFCWRNFRRFLFGLACFATLIALFYAEEDWRGKHDWEKYKHEWEAKGDKFDFKDFIPPPVPDDENFAFSPVWIAQEKYTFQNTPKKAEAWYGDRIYSEEVSKIVPLLPVTVSAVVGTNWAYHLPNTPEISGHWTTAHMTDLKPWQSYYRDLEKTNPAAEISVAPQPQSPAADVLLALSKYDPVIEELRDASKLPYSRFPLDYDIEDPAEILLPHLSVLKQCGLALQLRAIAELQNGESEKAFDDVKLSLRLMDSIHSEPFIISQLVRFAVFQITLQPIYEGLAEHKWSDAQLAALDSELSKLDFPADYEFSVRGERASAGKILDWMEQKRSRFWLLFDMVDSDTRNTMNHLDVAMMIYLMPKGWYYQNELVLAQMDQQWNLPMVNDSQQIVAPQMTRDSAAAVNTMRPTPFNFFARLALPSLGNYAQKTAYGQNAVNMAHVAIALERDRIAHGEFPESLDALSPQFIEKIPHDIINGQPLHYRRTSDGQFVLYSVGWNETDDGGIVVFKNGSAPRDEWKAGIDMNKGDWVWQYPSK